MSHAGMKKANILLARCRGMGASLTPFGNDIWISAPARLPDDVVTALKLLKPQLIRELRAERQENAWHWMLEEWRRTAVPTWRRALSKSIRSGDARGEDYARWMLREILQDLEYEEPSP